MALILDTAPLYASLDRRHLHLLRPRRVDALIPDQQQRDTRHPRGH